MKNYDVYFEIFGKKMKTQILVDSTADANKKVKDKIIFHKTVISENDEFNQATDILDNILDLLG